MSWEETGTNGIGADPTSPYAYRRCSTCRTQAYCRPDKRCPLCPGCISEAIETPPAGVATHGHEVSCRRRGEGGYLPPSVEELREYEGPHD